jgi:hypothetical protein
VEEHDPDGVELLFASSEESRKSRDSRQLTATATSVRPQGRGELETVLTNVLANYQARLVFSLCKKQPIRPLSIYLLTDGAWEGGGNPEVPLLGLLETLKTPGLPANQVGIQFISFGNNPGGLKRMRELDDMSKGFDLEK